MVQSRGNEEEGIRVNPGFWLQRQDVGTEDLLSGRVMFEAPGHTLLEVG